MTNGANQCGRRAFLQTLGLGSPFLLMPGCSHLRPQRAALSNTNPNILFVYTDDQAPWALGASGNPQAHTPNMDRLVREGVYLPNSFTVTPVCSPSRASLLTSRYGSELGVLDFIPQKGHRLYTTGEGLAPGTITFPLLLSQAGYATGLIGKWHVGEPDNVHPTRMGYDEFMGFRGGGISPVDPVLEKDGVEKEFKGLTCDILTDHAVDFIERHHGERFFLSVHYRAPHKAWLPVSPEDWEPYENLDARIPNPDYPALNVPKMKKWMCEYLASVSGVDRNLGRLLAALERFGLSRNTVVIFTSDHGYNMGITGFGIRGTGSGRRTNTHGPPATETIASRYRPNLYDNSIRVPAIIRWPDGIEAGTVVRETVSNLDWHPTLLALAGAEPPSGTVVRGRSILPLLEGRDVAWDNDFYAEYSMRHYCRTDMRMHRTERWKLVRDFLNPERDEFYDLREDPAERRNLIGDERGEIRAAIEDLHERILGRMREIGDPALALAGG